MKSFAIKIQKDIFLKRHQLKWILFDNFLKWIFYIGKTAQKQLLVYFVLFKIFEC